MIKSRRSLFVNHFSVGARAVSPFSVVVFHHEKPNAASEEGKRALKLLKKEEIKDKVLAIFENSENFLTKDKFESLAAQCEISAKNAQAAKTTLTAEGKIKSLIPKQQGANYLFGPTRRILEFYIQHTDMYTLK